MKKLLLVICCLSSLMLTLPTAAQDTTTIVETSSHSIFTGLFKSVWARLKSLNPAQKESARSDVLYNAGIRGAESTDTLLKPYWKDDLTRDEEFQAELQMFSLAQLKMDQGKLEDAVGAFDTFLGEFGQSNLRPNALFGKSISLAGLVRKEESRNTMQQFVDENPNHPLIVDARQVIAELS
ncbi:MAG: hypothetical protein GY896_20675 [Gammaproteobacteria bacterium]|nr:hypothetical protein [Gammaproteobacteria bacterium]